MVRLFYSLSIYLYVAAIHIAAVFHAKARLWVNGRKNWKRHLADWRKENPGELYWIHCASLGEFEQGRPLIERWRKERPQTKILLTFFSPSGYEMRKNYSEADHVCYLPADTITNARAMLSILNPDRLFVVKYEYWANLFLESKSRKIPIYMVSAILRPDQRFFGTFAFFWKEVLASVTHFFVQTQETLGLLQKSGFRNATLTGDTRFDRVVTIASSAKTIEELEVFRSASKCLVAGSSWPAEEEILAKWMNTEASKGWKLILVPHEIHRSHIDAIRVAFPEAICWTEKGSMSLADVRILVLDTMGMLSAVYRYADMAVIGGGFGVGIHNTLEAAVWGVPVVFGPHYQKFHEAIGLIQNGGGFSSSDKEKMAEILNRLALEDGLRSESGEKAREFVKENSGATNMIMSILASSDQK